MLLHHVTISSHKLKNIIYSTFHFDGLQIVDFGVAGSVVQTKGSSTEKGIDRCWIAP